MRTPTPAKRRYRPQSRISTARARFAKLLAGHLGAGTRPATPTGEPWTYADFAGNVPSSRDHPGKSGYVSPRSVSNWCKGASLPDAIEPILRALFGTGDRHTQAREALRGAFQSARAEKNAAIIARAKREPAG